jgi:hypothetical protein
MWNSQLPCDKPTFAGQLRVLHILPKFRELNRHVSCSAQALPGQVRLTNFKVGSCTFLQGNCVFLLKALHRRKSDHANCLFLVSSREFRKGSDRVLQAKHTLTGRFSIYMYDVTMQRVLKLDQLFPCVLQAPPPGAGQAEPMAAAVLQAAKVVRFRYLDCSLRSCVLLLSFMS